MKRAWMLQGLVVAGWVAGAPAFGAEHENDLPEDAFLEFLGGFEDADGEWVDPMSLAELDANADSAEGEARIKAEPDGEENDEG